MGVLRIDHPDIEQFIHAKQNQDRLTGFNVSIAVTDEFMDCLATGRPFELKWGGQVYNEVNPNALWEAVMRSTWDWAEPGVLFIDTINQRNNLWYAENIAATNPCGEQPLPPYGACLLGSFNLTRYVSDAVDIKTGRRTFNWEQFRSDIEPVVRAMDNVVDNAIYPLYEQEKEAKNKRRMGLGITGLANALEAMGMPYGSIEFIAMQRKILETLRNESYAASAELAADKGAFPKYNAQHYLDGWFINQLPKEVRNLIVKNGIRNSHLTSIAPTGTISMTADNVSSGIEPVFAYTTDRMYIGPDGPEQVTIEDYGFSKWGVKGKKTSNVTVDEHLAVLECASELVDSAVSKTCNVDPSMDWDDFKSVYERAHAFGAKGCTTFNIGGKRFGILEDADEKDNGEEEAEATCRIDLETGRRECE